MSEQETEQTSKPGSTSDMTVSSLLRLAGIPTVSDMKLVEAKLDRLDRKLTSMQAKLDKLSLTLGASSQEGFYDRVDFQLAELKSMLSKVTGDV